MEQMAPLLPGFFERAPGSYREVSRFAISPSRPGALAISHA
ncbi:hypothetical protein F610DRAFT_06883 [Streptomyces sp. LaPpAH-199]|nr:hypothetical protein F610DRAFT_06883 [Streptomyces sp. LaPpAH-199]